MRRYRKLCESLLASVKKDKADHPGHIELPSDDELSQFFEALSHADQMRVAAIIFCSGQSFQIPEQFFREPMAQTHTAQSFSDVVTDGKVH